MAYGYTGYGYYNPYSQGFQQQPQQQQNNVQVFPAVYVSNKNEVEGVRPDQNNNPMYFHNRAAKEIYLKQYDSTGAAPILTFKLVENSETEQNQAKGELDTLNQKIDFLIQMVKKEKNNIEEKKTEEKKDKK